MGWKVGEVSCGFLFTALALRGAGTGCLLTTLGRRGEGRRERVQEGKPDAMRQIQRAGGREQTRARADTGGNGAKRVPELNVSEPGKKNRESERGCKPPPVSEPLAVAALPGQEGQQGGRTYKTPNLQRERQLGFNRR